jgi:hypothetical protein
MRLVLLGLVVLSAGAAPAQDVYKWIDDEGVMSYAETPPEGVDAVRTDVRYQRTDKAQLQARLDGQQAMNEAIATRERQAKEQADEQADVAARNKEASAENCRLAQERRQKYTEAHRLYRPTEDGGREYLTDAELDAERAAANQAVMEWCGNQ